jgi:hypothetical protein
MAQCIYGRPAFGTAHSARTACKQILRKEGGNLTVNYRPVTVESDVLSACDYLANNMSRYEKVPTASVV